MNTQPQPRLILNLREAADLLGIRPSQLYEQTRTRARVRQRIPIPHLRLGKRICFRRESLEKWVAQLEAEVRS
jgi:predicted DNA-binding transcriptional regulator AlpA